MEISEEQQTVSPIITEDSAKEETQKVEANEEEKDHQREKSKWTNYVPPEAKRPFDEYYDLTQIQPIRVEEVTSDKGIIKYVLEEGKGTLIEAFDDVFYKHETRFDNGALVDFNEKRKAVDKFEMKDQRFHDFYKIVMKTMRKGEVAWIRFTKAYHKNIYHNSPFFQQKTEEEKAKIGEDIVIKFSICNIKRNPQCTDSNTFEGILVYYGKIREVCKELIEEKEYANAEGLYKRILPMFKNMPKKMKDSLTEEQIIQKNEVLHTLNLNLALCHVKRNNPKEAIKSAKDAISINDKNPKAHYRIAQAYKMENDFERCKESLTAAIRLAPGDQNLRKEYKELMDTINAKHKEWYGKMNGFLHSEKMQEIEQKDEEEHLLKEKFYRKELADYN